MVRTLTSAASAAGILALSLPVVAQPVPQQKYPYKSGPVTIASCTVNENTSNSTVSPNSLRINYFNNDPATKLTSITFRVRYAGTPVTITDTGEFDPKQSVTHQFNQLGGLPWAGANASVCRVLTATFADGRTVNPHYDGPDGNRPDAGAMPNAGAMPAPEDSAMPSAGETAAPPAAPVPTPT